MDFVINEKYPIWLENTSNSINKSYFNPGLMTVDCRVYGKYICASCKSFWTSTFCWISCHDVKKCRFCKIYNLPVQLVEKQTETITEPKQQIWRQQHMTNGPFECADSYEETVTARYECEKCADSWESQNCSVIVHWSQICKKCDSSSLILPYDWSMLQRSKNPSNKKKAHEGKYCKKCIAKNCLCVI